MNPLFEEFFSLLRFSLGIEADSSSSHSETTLRHPERSASEVEGSSNAPKQPFTHVLTAEEWRWLHEQAKRQCLLGVLYKGIEKLPADHRPPRDLLLRWSLEANQIAAMNTRMNETAARVTKLFDEKGVRSVILKGQANALLYPDPGSRQAGDIDILVQGGRKQVIALLKEMDLAEGLENTDFSDIHAHLKPELFGGITVEVHYAPTYNNSPFSTRRMLKYLDGELVKANPVAEGFNVPPATFALVMQLSHLMRHFYSEGVGLRQLVDYYLLLKNSTQADRVQVSAQLENCGLRQMAGAVMWTMQRVFRTPREQMICPPDPWRGNQLFGNVVSGGNFGKYSREHNLPTFLRWLADRMRPLKRFRFCAGESLWHEARYIRTFVQYIPKRIKHRKISVRTIR